MLHTYSLIESKSIMMIGLKLQSLWPLILQVHKCWRLTKVVRQMLFAALTASTWCMPIVLPPSNNMSPRSLCSLLIAMFFSSEHKWKVLKRKKSTCPHLSWLMVFYKCLYQFLSPFDPLFTWRVGLLYYGDLDRVNTLLASEAHPGAFLWLHLQCLCICTKEHIKFHPL